MSSEKRSSKALDYFVNAVWWIGLTLWFLIPESRKYLEAIVIFVLGYNLWGIAKEAIKSAKQVAEDISRIHSLLVQINNRGAGTELQRLWDEQLREKALAICERAKTERPGPLT